MTEAEQAAHEQGGRRPVDALPGQAFGSGYLLQREIGVGGMGTVWRGWARARRQPVAIKILHPHLSGDRSVVSRFLREGDVLTRLDHPNLVKVHDLVVEGGRLGLVMDLVEGSDLHARRRLRGTLSPAEAARIGAQAAGALAAAHAMGVVHLDLKPANILISGPEPEQQFPEDAAEPGAAASASTSADTATTTATAPATATATDADAIPAEARLTDFGIARIVDGADQTTTAVTFGTPDYMAPETALDGAASPASDLYALGITLYELVVGRTPYAGGPALTVLARHLERTPRRLPTIPGPLWDVIEACTARDPADRPDAARTAAMLTAAEPALAGIPAAEPLPAGSDYRATSEVRRAGAIAAAIAADTVALDPTVATRQQRPGGGESEGRAQGPAQEPQPVQAPLPGPLPAFAPKGIDAVTAAPAPALAAAAAPAPAPAADVITPTPTPASASAPAADIAASAPASAAAPSAPGAPAADVTAPTPPPASAAAFALPAADAETRSATEPVLSSLPPAMLEPAADFGTAYYAGAAALKPPPDGPFPTASPTPSRRSRFSGRKTADVRSARRAERGPLVSRRAKRRTALICAPLLLFSVVGGLLVASGAFASLQGNQHNASKQLPAAAASSRSGPGSGKANHGPALAGASPSTSASAQSSASATDGSGTTLSGSGAPGSGASGAAGSGSGTGGSGSGGSGSGSSGSGSGGSAPAPTQAAPAPVDTGWVCRSGGWKDDGSLSVDPCIDYDNGTLYLRGSVQGSYGSSVVIALRVDYGGTYSRTYYSSAFVPASSGTKTVTVTVGSWPSGENITCEENVDPASDESDYEYGANSADITT
ncbi:MAG TPA: serine/threonine-protein kinase [Actinocrinis sp.]